MGNIKLTYNQRLEIEKHIFQSKSYREIGEKLNLHYTTIFYEIRRNGGRKSYSPSKADEHVFHLRRSRYRKKYLLENTVTAQRVEGYLKQGLTPLVMVERCKKEGKSLPISHQTIYNFIHQHKPNWKKYLPYLKKKKWKSKRARKNEINSRKTSIIERDRAANEREVLGHYEIDTIHLDQGAILTMIDRRSRFLIATVLKDRKAETTTRALIEIICDIGKQGGKVESITSDNGLEFAGYEEIKNRFSIKYYHCNPYASWQRGSNENVNRILRRHFPKKGNTYQNISVDDLKRVVDMINLTPRKILNYNTPYEAYFRKFIPLIFNC